MQVDYDTYGRSEENNTTIVDIMLVNPDKQCRQYKQVHGTYNFPEEQDKQARFLNDHDSGTKSATKLADFLLTPANEGVLPDIILVDYLFDCCFIIVDICFYYCPI